MKPIKAWAVKGKDDEGEYLLMEERGGPPSLYRTRDAAKDICAIGRERPVRVEIHVKEEKEGKGCERSEK